MKNKIKAIILLAICIWVTNIIKAQPPAPPQGNQNHAQHSTHRGNIPVGTATGLLITLCVGYTAYKIRKNTKNNNSINNKDNKQ